jgi:AcrR family transcriptional regulator
MSTKKVREKPGKHRILDAAEQLFARHGFYGVSVRDITEEAGVDVALVNYHFGSKRELFTAVFQRRAELLNPERLARLEEVRRAALPGVATLEDIVNSFTSPMLERSARGGPGWKSYFALVAQVSNSPEWGPVLMTQHFDPLVERFIEVVREALPGCSPRDVYWGYQFLTGALTLTFAETGRIDKLSGGLCKSSDLDSVHERLAPYVAAGFRALCRGSAGKNPRAGAGTGRAATTAERAAGPAGAAPALAPATLKSRAPKPAKRR